MSLDQILLKSNIRDYKVNFCETSDFIKSLGEIPNALFIVDSMVWDCYSEGYLECLKNFDHIILPISEELKSLESVRNIYDQIINKAAKKNLNLISIGGGILQDITGFVASTLYRGINWCFAPTTLLAQADSCIGAKTSLNYKHFKNIIGTFYPPSLIHIFTPFLKTLKQVDYFSGVGEVAKLHLMGGEKDISDFEKCLIPIMNCRNDVLLQVIRRSLMIKKSYIEEDEFDRGRRNLLNYGHCFGHAIESATDFVIPHGQAVVIGILLANRVSLRRKLIVPKTEEYLRENVLIPILKIDLKTLVVDDEVIIKAMKQDKKRTGEDLALVTMKNGFEMIMLNDMSVGEAKEALRILKEL